MRGINKFFSNRYIDILIDTDNFDAIAAAQSWEDGLYDDDGNFQGCSATFAVTFPGKGLVYRSGSGATEVRIAGGEIHFVDLTGESEHIHKLAEEIKAAFVWQTRPERYFSSAQMIGCVSEKNDLLGIHHGQIVGWFYLQAEATDD